MIGDKHTAAGVSAGDILVGKYRIDKVLGVGGMGVVVAAHHIHLDERVAIKFMLLEALMNRDAVGRFAREARAAVKIKSEHVCRVSDVGTMENGAPFMVMEYLEGSDLSAWLLQYGVLPIEQAVDFLLQASEAIAEAHSLGIVHRDLKPANLFVIRRPDGVLAIKVLDFGISKMTGFGTSGSGSDMTQTSAIMGSPLYMSPEQMQSSKDVDPRADIWALGVILYELLGGRLPFAADTMPELVLKVVSAPPAPLREQRPDVPAELELIIGRCLEKDRNQRYASVGDLAASLMPYGSRRARMSVEKISGILQGAGISTSPLVGSVRPGQPVPALQAGTQSNFGHTNGGGGRARVWLIVGAVLALGVLALVAFALRPQHAEAPKLSAAEALQHPPPVVAPLVTAELPRAPSVAPAPPIAERPVASATNAPAASAAASARRAVASLKAVGAPQRATATNKPSEKPSAAAPAATPPPAAPKAGPGLFSDRN
jgi:tRNA A-37 threonylcarbamoyl transferase component Bud32